MGNERLITPALEYVRCPTCESAPSILWMKNGLTKYIRCLDCGTIFASPRLPRASRFAWLEETFSASPNTFMYTQSRQSALNSEAEIIKSMKQEGRLLDIGCCTGGLFEFFKGQGWHLHGVEISPSSANYAAKNYKVKVHSGTLETATFPHGYFDVITMIDMFYYVDDPRSELTRISRLLRPDGLLAIEIPGQSYMMSRSRGPLCFLSSGKWSRVSSSSSYLFWYTPKSLDRLLNKCGFKAIKWEPIVASSSLKSGKMLNFYDSVTRRAAKRCTFFLSWASKYLCLAVLDTSLSKKKTMSFTRSLDHQQSVQQNCCHTIRPAQENDVSEIAILHHKYISDKSIPTTVHSDIGAISEYYRVILLSRNASIYVACSEEQVIGYSSIVKNQVRQILNTMFGRPSHLKSLLKNKEILRLSSFGYIISKFRHETSGKWPKDTSCLKDAYELRSVAVEPAYRKLSVGSALLRASLEHARIHNFSPLITWVAESNVPSIYLFQRAGFRKVGEKSDVHGKVYLFASSENQSGETLNGLKGCAFLRRPSR